MWEQPCVAKGPQSGPGNLCMDADILGPLRGPFATQGRSHKEAAPGWLLGKPATFTASSYALWRIVATLPVASPPYSLLETQLARSLLKAARVYTTTG
ncbi:hypothetical protein PPUN109347_31680 [Pseudomonas putida]|nr:hypothetical protein PPUN109347_31680 [Pseudomonas putida]